MCVVCACARCGHRTSYAKTKGITYILKVLKELYDIIYVYVYTYVIGECFAMI